MGRADAAAEVAAGTVVEAGTLAAAGSTAAADAAATAADPVQAVGCTAGVDFIIARFLYAIYLGCGR